MGAPDTPEGRFELLSAHIILLTEALANAGATAAAQEVFDLFLSDLDGALREMAVGDLAVPGRMKRLGRAYFGRALAYRAAFTAFPDEGPLQALAARTVLAGAPQSDPAPLACYLAACRESLARTPTALLIAGAPSWPNLE